MGIADFSYDFDSRSFSQQLEDARAYFTKRAKKYAWFRAAIKSLAGKTLLCTCDEDRPSHGDILIDLWHSLQDPATLEILPEPTPLTSEQRVALAQFQQCQETLLATDATTDPLRTRRDLIGRIQVLTRAMAIYLFDQEVRERPERRRRRTDHNTTW